MKTVINESNNPIYGVYTTNVVHDMMAELEERHQTYLEPKYDTIYDVWMNLDAELEEVCLLQ